MGIIYECSCGYSFSTPEEYMAHAALSTIDDIAATWKSVGKPPSVNGQAIKTTLAPWYIPDAPPEWTEYLLKSNIILSGCGLTIATPEPRYRMKPPEERCEPPPSAPLSPKYAEWLLLCCADRTLG